MLIFRGLTAALVALVCCLSAQDNPKPRIRGLRDLGKQGSRAIPQITPYLADVDVDVRRQAVKSLVEIGTQDSLDPLVKATADNDPEVQIRAVDGLVNFYLPGYVQDAGMTSSLRRFGTEIKGRFTDTNDQVMDPYIQVRPEVIEAIGRVVRGGASMESRAAAARAAGILRGRAAVPDLLAAVKSRDSDVIYESLVALGKIKDSAAGPGIAFRLHDPVEKVQLAAIETTGLLRNPGANAQLRDIVEHGRSPKASRAALTALAMMPEGGTRSLFLNELQDKDEGLRAAAAEGLGRLHDPADKAQIEKAYLDEGKPLPRAALAFASVEYGNRDLTDFAPLRYLVNQLNSQAYRGVALAYLTELARDPATRDSLVRALQTSSATRDEKVGIAQILGASGDDKSVATLESLSRDPDTEVQRESLRALQNLRSRLSASSSHRPLQ